MPLQSVFKRNRPVEPARRIYAVIVRQARCEPFYRDFGIPDTVDGRFEMIVLHAFLVLRRLKTDGGATDSLGQELFDVMFDDMDVNLREMGAGDMGVGKRVRKMVQAFYGRLAAYDDALDREDDGLAEALVRNLYGTVATPPDDGVEMLAEYVRRQAQHIEAVETELVRSGDFAFAEVLP